MNIHWSRHDSVGEVKEFGVESMKAKLSELDSSNKKVEFEKERDIGYFHLFGRR